MPDLFAKPTKNFVLFKDFLIHDYVVLQLKNGAAKYLCTLMPGTYSLGDIVAEYATFHGIASNPSDITTKIYMRHKPANFVKYLNNKLYLVNSDDIYEIDLDNLEINQIFTGSTTGYVNIFIPHSNPNYYRIVDSGLTVEYVYDIQSKTLIKNAESLNRDINGDSFAEQLYPIDNGGYVAVKNNSTTESIFYVLDENYNVIYDYTATLSDADKVIPNIDSTGNLIFANADVIYVVDSLGNIINQYTINTGLTSLSTITIKEYNGIYILGYYDANGYQKYRVYNSATDSIILSSYSIYATNIDVIGDYIFVYYRYSTSSYSYPKLYIYDKSGNSLYSYFGSTTYTAIGYGYTSDGNAIFYIDKNVYIMPQNIDNLKVNATVNYLSDQDFTNDGTALAELYIELIGDSTASFELYLTGAIFADTNTNIKNYSNLAVIGSTTITENIIVYYPGYIKLDFRKVVL